MSEVTGDQLLRDHLRRWAEELVDLSRRNRLLYFKHTASASLEFAQSGTEVIAGLGSGGWNFYLPDPPDDDDQLGLEVGPSVRELIVNMTPERTSAQIRRGLKNLATTMQSEFLDAGIWILYLGIGRLNWEDADGKKAMSPLLLVPVKLTQDTASKTWKLSESEDGESALNPALAVKLDADFDIVLPPLEDLDEPDLPTVLRAVRKAVSGTDWTVDESTVLSTFTFQKEVIYRDLQDNQAEIMAHDMVKLLAEGPSSDISVALDFVPENEDTLDQVHPPEDLTLVLDADVTQRQCLLAASAGRSFVMDGPPGTGKSQTIANLIAQLMADGKTILFVSEKAAALEVVQNRLAKLSLDPFVLALHSRSATRKAVAQELGNALEQLPVARARFDPTNKSRLMRSRIQLSDYASAMNLIRIPLERSLHDAIGRISHLSTLPSVSIPQVDMRGLSPAKLAEVRDLGDQLGRAWGPIARGDDFVWRNIRPGSSEGANEADLRRRVEACAIALNHHESTSNLITEELRLPDSNTPMEGQLLIELLQLIEGRFPIGPAWLSAESPAEVTDSIRQLGADLQSQLTLTQRLDGLAERWRDLDPSSHEGLAGLDQQLRNEEPPVVLPDTVNHDGLDSLAATLDAMVANLVPLIDPATVLSQAFGLVEAPSLNQARRLAELGKLVGATTPPEPAWLSPLAVEALEEARRVLAELLIAYRARRESLRTVFTERVLQLDLQALQVRFCQVHTGFGKLSGAYRADKKLLASVTVSGKVTKEELSRLSDALEWQTLTRSLAQAEQRHVPLIGQRYYPSRDRADVDQIENAIDIALRAISYAAGEIDGEHLSGQLGLGATPDPNTPVAALSAQNVLGRLDSELGILLKALPDSDFQNVPIQSLIDWGRRVSLIIRAVAWYMDSVGDAGTSVVTFTEARELLELCGKHASQDEEIAREFDQLGTYLGDLTKNVEPDRFENASDWVNAIHQFFGGPVPQRTADLLLVTDMTASAITDAVQALDKSLAELISRFDEPQASEVTRDLLGTFDGGRELLDHLANTVSDASEWESYLGARSQLGQLGWEPVVLECEEKRIEADAVGDVLERSALQRWVDQILASDARLTPRRSIDRDTLQIEFKRLDEALVHDAAANVINACAARRPRSLAGEAGVINQQALLKRKHKPVRQLLAQAGAVTQRLKPCFMMSPLSASHFLPPNLRFDVVIFDEASQVREADAICCVYRGNQLIVAGDPRQLPPTAFFQRVADGDDEDLDDEVLDFESILDRCKAQGFPALPLSWHYRSRHESLITFSNYSFYDGRLHTFPGATFEAPDLGVELFKVAGQYGRGGTVDNPIEAEQVVDRIVFHRRRHPELTLGVVALSVRQKLCIEAAIERRSEHEIELRELITDSRLDGFFVKNLENVQGDERDLIIISIGYGPDEFGKLTMNFGPMSKPGGERRLNVAVTRAKRRVEVISSISAGQITSDNPTTRLLARYLDYAERGSPALALDLAGSVGEAESPFEEEVIGSIRALGFDPVPQVGVAGYRIDVGVRHPTLPGNFVLGVECDGAAYHSSKVARDRDRLRQSVLEDLGWTMHRIWSTAWFTDRAAEEERLRVTIEAAVNGTGHKKLLSTRSDPEVEVLVEEIDFEEPPTWARTYEYPKLATVYTTTEFTDPVARPQIGRQILEVVGLAGPIHEDDVLAVLRGAWSIGRAGQRIRDSFDGAVRSLIARRALERSGQFLALPEPDIHVRVPKDENAIPRKIGSVPAAELMLAILKLLEDAGPSDPDNLRTAWARLFGWRRIGSDIEIGFESTIDSLLSRGKIVGPAPLRLA